MLEVDWRRWDAAKESKEDKVQHPRRSFSQAIEAIVPEKLRGSTQKLLGTVATIAASATGHLNPLLNASFHQNPNAAFVFYRISNPHRQGGDDATKKDMIARAVEFGYLSWPRRIRSFIQNKDVLDVGCGTGIHGIGYAVVGVKSYVGMDPIIKPDNDRAKNVRKRMREPFGWTPRQICDQFGNIELFPGTFESFDSNRLFDVAVMHNVTEHLIHIDQVLRDTAKQLRPGGKIIFNHHNFYCWNGHHLLPRTLDEIDLSDPDQQQYMDWAHIRFDPPEDHYIRRGLNKIKLDELRELVERDYIVETWNELPSSEHNGGGRLTDEIVASFAELTRRDLIVHNVFCVATKK